MAINSVSSFWRVNAQTKGQAAVRFLGEPAHYAESIA
jgi:hypothetical protein